MTETRPVAAHVDIVYPPAPVVCRWRLKVRDPATGLYVPVRERRNKFTDAGLTNLAQLWMGSGTPSLYLVIDSFKPTINNNPLAAGAVSVTLAATSQPHKTGDTQLVLGVGLASQETVTWTAVTTGSGTWTYTLQSGTLNLHNQGEWAVRQVQQSDVLADIVAEVQYDSVAFPMQRMAASGAGFSSGTANWTMQFFLTGDQALADWVTLGLATQAAVGTGALTNHLLFGYTHPQGNDVELDISLTLANA